LLRVCKKGAAAPEILVPAGTAWVGAADTDKLAAKDEKPIHQVKVPAFYIDTTEVTIDDFAAFVKDTGYRTTAEKRKVKETWKTYYRPNDVGDKKANGKWPVILVSHKDAEAYADWKGKRLPTEAKWERAARGDTRNVYPWGDKWNDSKCNNHEISGEGNEFITNDFDYGSPIPVGSIAADASPLGVRDMAGNVAEWVANQMEAYEDSEYVVRGAERRFYVFKGGTWGGGKDEARISFRGRGPSGQADVYVGFRLARDAKE